jgi:hypothetical protein
VLFVWFVVKNRYGQAHITQRGQFQMIRMLLAAAAVSLTFAASASAAPANPMLMVIHQHVADYAKWRPVYDAHGAARVGAGLSNCSVRQTTDDANDVFVACNMADVAKAKAFAGSASLADAMKNAGVIGKPDIYFLTGAK